MHKKIKILWTRTTVGKVVGDLVAPFVGHGCPVGGPELFHWACGGIGLQPIFHYCPAKYVYSPVEFFTWPVKYFTWPVNISHGN